MGKVICICNEKGGTAKTTITVNLGAALAIRGKKTLIIDMDPQGNSSYVLSNINDDVPSIYSVLTEKETPLETIIQPTSTKDLYIAPSNLHLSGAEIQLAHEFGRESALKRRLPEAVRQNFDSILIDTSPSLGLLTINSIVASDFALVPVSCDFFSMVGLNLLFDTIRLAQENLGSTIRVLGIVANKYDRRERISDEVLGLLKTNFNNLLFKTIIRVNVKLKEAPSFRKTIYEYDPVCPGAKDHLALANELIEKISL